MATELSDEYDIIIFGGAGEVDIAGDIEQGLANNNITNYTNLAGQTIIAELIDKISNLAIQRHW